MKPKQPCLGCGEIPDRNKPYYRPRTVASPQPEPVRPDVQPDAAEDVQMAENAEGYLRLDQITDTGSFPVPRTTYGEDGYLGSRRDAFLEQHLKTFKPIEGAEYSFFLFVRRGSCVGFSEGI